MLGVRDRRAHERDLEHARHVQVVDVGALAPQQRRVLDPPYRERRRTTRRRTRCVAVIWRASCRRRRRRVVEGAPRRAPAPGGGGTPASALRSVGGSVPSSATSAACSARRRRRASAGLDRGRRAPGVEPMLTSATPGSSPPTAATPTIAQSWARRLNFWNAQPGAGGLRHPHLGDHLVGRERGLEEPLEEVVGRDRALAAAPPRDDRAARARARTAGRSDAGSPCASEPPSVPR